MADFDWSWPAKIERDIIERALTLDFLGETRNLILVEMCIRDSSCRYWTAVL